MAAASKLLLPQLQQPRRLGHPRARRPSDTSPSALQLGWTLQASAPSLKTLDEVGRGGKGGLRGTRLS